MCVGAIANPSGCGLLSSAQYFGTTTGGNDVYQNTDGTFVDDNGNPVTSALAQDAAQNSSDMGSPTAPPSQSPLHTPAPNATVHSAGSGGVSTAGLTGLFAAIGSGFATTVNPPKTVGGVSMVYSAATGGYVPASAAASVGAAGAASNITLYLVIGAVALAVIVIFMAKK